MNKAYFIFLSLFLIQVTFAESLESQLKTRREASAKKVPKDIKKVMNEGVRALRNSELHKRAIGVGKKVPVINFMDLDKKRVSLSDLYEKGPVILTFYRGGWCPYCMLELDAYQKLLDKIQKAGGRVVAVSPDTIKEAKKTLEKRGLGFSVLTDPNNRAAHLFGLAFKVDKGTLDIYQKFGIDLKESQGNDNFELPMPGTYLIDRTGTIRFSFVDPDYTKRAEPEEVLAVLKSL